MCAVVRDSNIEGTEQTTFPHPDLAKSNTKGNSGATAIAKDKGKTKWYWMSECLLHTRLCAGHFLNIIPFRVQKKSVRCKYYYPHFPDESIVTWHPRSPTQHNWGLNLNLCDCESPVLFSMPYTQIYYIACTTSQRLFFTVVTPLNLYYRVCLYYSYVSNRFFCFKRKYTNLNLNMKIWAIIIHKCCLKLWKCVWNWLEKPWIMILPQWQLYFRDYHWKIYRELISFGLVVPSLNIF